MGLQGHYSLRAFTARQNHQFGSLLPTADEIQARRGEKTTGIDQQRGCGFHHVNARSHTSLAPQQILGKFGWEGLMHPPYSPDLATSDFHLFRSFQNSLCSILPGAFASGTVSTCETPHLSLYFLVLTYAEHWRIIVSINANFNAGLVFVFDTSHTFGSASAHSFSTIVPFPISASVSLSILTLARFSILLSIPLLIPIPPQITVHILMDPEEWPDKLTVVINAVTTGAPAPPVVGGRARAARPRPLPTRARSLPRYLLPKSTFSLYMGILRASRHVTPRHVSQRRRPSPSIARFVKPTFTEIARCLLHGKRGLSLLRMPSRMTSASRRPTPGLRPTCA
ncbi:hypothetical protein EVAR_13663_1 [Eumeta japonica]|uniref:Histone-lysine N-methyltransferase SETMAR n=1 Tax=Eumeta variegata TaxID=151549 RepID=A0A4C1UBI2_EUMVA|nr:hypothetical protein EVAR_13663_1 [Eumeta japonica]